MRSRCSVWVAVALLAVATNHVAAADAPEHMTAFAECFARQNCLAAERTSWRHFTEDFPSCHALGGAWWSRKPSGIPVTLVTQLSFTRLDQLRAQCDTWLGPLAAAVYLPLVNPGNELSEGNRKTLQDAAATVQQFFNASEAHSTPCCQLRLALMYELFNDTRAALLLYPVNTLRNYARLMADTDLITNIDVDLLPSMSISAALADLRTLANYTDECRRGAVFVWPAFQSNCNRTDEADEIARSGKAALQRGLETCVHIFEYRYPVFHGPTNYDRWLGGGDVYRVQYKFNYEPWFMGWRLTTQWFDFRYRGYGFNKCVHAAATNASGATWLVSPHGFVLHRPHNLTAMRTLFVHGKATRNEVQDLRSTMYGHVLELWEAAQRSVNATGRFAVAVEDSFRSCMASLPWWAGGAAMPAGS